MSNHTTIYLKLTPEAKALLQLSFCLIPIRYSKEMLNTKLLEVLTKIPVYNSNLNIYWQLIILLYSKSNSISAIIVLLKIWGYLTTVRTIKYRLKA